MNSTASPEETQEFMDLLLLQENEQSLRESIQDALQTENEYSLPSSSAQSIVSNIFETGKKNELAFESRKRKKWVFTAYSIAAAFILLMGIGFYFEVVVKHQKYDHSLVARQEKKITKDIEPGSNKAILTLGSGKRVFLDSTALGAIVGQPGISLINANGQLTYKDVGVSTVETDYNTVTVPRKGQYHLILSDGTKVWLNAESSLHFPTAFTGNERIVELTGEGYFEIAKDPSKPFHVKASGTDVQALGTHFNVMAYDNESSLQATLLEGSVKVTHGNDSCILKPGRAASINKNKNNIDVKSADVEQVMAWKEGFFLFNDKTPLPSVLRQMERWYDIDVNYEGVIPDQNFGGGIQRSLPLSGVLSVLQESGIRFRVNDKQITVLK